MMEAEEGVIAETLIDGKPGKVVKLGKIPYRYVEAGEHNLGYVPAYRVGYYRDLATGGETFVNPLHACEPYLLKTVKANSEFDLTATLIALAQQIRYGKECTDESCYKGYYDNGEACNTCGGDGVRATASSAQDSIVIPIPKNPEERIPLDELIKWVSPPVDIVKWQEDYIEGLTRKCTKIMFNSDLFTKSEVAETAHGKNLDMQNVYDTLHPFAISYARIWTFGTKAFAALTDMDKKLVANLTFGKDFKLKTLDSLILDLSTANNLNNAALKAHLNDDIAEIIFSEKPLELQRYKLKEFYNPFKGKTEAEIKGLMASDFVALPQKVLHANAGYIFDQLEVEFSKKTGTGEQNNFYLLKREEQETAIYAKVNEIIEAIKGENPEPVIPVGN